jgi:hypothetical protein
MTDPYTPRTDSTQLPSAHELLDILTKESQRKAVRFDFIQRNNVIFGVHRKLSKLANSDDSWIDQYRELPLAELVSKVDQNHAELARYIQEHPSEQTLYQDFYRALIPNEKSAKTDAIFVFGAASNARIERAIELYNDGIAQKIIISGNSPHYLEGVQSEASRMNWRPAALTIVATNFVLTRATMEWYKFCPWDITIVPVAAYPQSSKFTAEGWYNDSSTIALVLNDYAKIVLESKIDLMRRDGEIA